MVHILACNVDLELSDCFDISQASTKQYYRAACPNGKTVEGWAWMIYFTHTLLGIWALIQAMIKI